MKVPIGPSDQEQVMKSYPLDGLVDGWFFRQDEVSTNHWVVEGTDLYGRKVFREGTDLAQLIRQYVQDAKDIRRQLG